MSAQPLPILGRIVLVQPSTTPPFEGVTDIKSKLKPITMSGDKEKTVALIVEFCERKYLSAPYVEKASVNHVLVEAVVMKYLRSLPDWEPTEELPPLKPITPGELLLHWVALTAKTTNIDLCRAHATYRKHYVLATDLIPAGAEGFDSLEWAQGLQFGGIESSSDIRYSSECEAGNSKTAVFHKVKPADWYKITRQLDATHPFPKSSRAWSYCIPAKGEQIPLEPLNNPMRASSASKPYSQGQQYKVWPAEALAIVGQALGKLSAEQRTLIRKGWEDAEYDSDFEKLLVRLERLSTPKVQAGHNWPYKQFRRIVDDAGGLMNHWDEYAGWNVNPWLLSELSYSPSHAIPVVDVSEPAQNDFQLFFPSAGDEKPSSEHHRYRGADVEILEDCSSNLRLVRYVCGERAPVWVPAEELISPKKKVTKRTQQVSQMYRCGERGCSCKPRQKYPEATPVYSGPTPQDDRERWLVAVGRQADWKYLDVSPSRPPASVNTMQMFRSAFGSK